MMKKGSDNMKNAIAVYLNYKKMRLTEYGVFLLNEDTPFLRDVLTYYFETYIDNYYYHIFHTVDTDNYNKKILKEELEGIMKEILYDYKPYELEVSNEEYASNEKLIQKARDLVYEIIKIEELEINNKEEIPSKIQDFVNNNKLIQEYLGNRLSKLIKLVTETYQKKQKLLKYNHQFFDVVTKKFTNHNDIEELILLPNIKSLDIYNKNMVNLVLQDKRLDLIKIECMIQKVSLEILKEYESNKNIKKKIIELPNTIINRGKIIPEIKELLDNSLLARYVILSIKFDMYKDYSNQLESDYDFACIYKINKQNNEGVKAIDEMAKELFFKYCIVKNCEFEKRDTYLEYQNEQIDVLLYEEE